MISIELHKNPLDKKPVKIDFPESWEDLSPELLATIAKVLYVTEDELSTLVGCLNVLLGLSRGKFLTIDADALEAKLLPLLAWMKEPYAITKQRFPTLNVGGTTYYGPDDELSNLVAVEFNFCELYLQDWNEDRKDLSHLWLLMACLYRPAKANYDIAKNPEGDIRELYNDNLIKGYAKELAAKVDIRYAYATVLYFKACHKKLQADFPNVWKGNEGEEGAPTPQVVPGYFNLMRMIAKEGTYGNFEAVERMYVVNMLTECECTIAEAAKTKEYIDSLKNKNPDAA